MPGCSKRDESRFHLCSSWDVYIYDRARLGGRGRGDVPCKFIPGPTAGKKQDDGGKYRPGTGFKGGDLLVMVLPADTESALAGTATWTTKHKKGTPPDDQVSPRPPHRRGRCQKRTREQGGGHLRGVRRSDMRGELGDAARGDHLVTARVEERGEVWLSQKQKSRGDSKNEKSCALHAAAAAGHHCPEDK